MYELCTRRRKVILQKVKAWIFFSAFFAYPFNYRWFLWLAKKTGDTGGFEWALDDFGMGEARTGFLKVIGFRRGLGFLVCWAVLWFFKRPATRWASFFIWLLRLSIFVKFFVLHLSCMIVYASIRIMTTCSKRMYANGFRLLIYSSCRRLIMYFKLLKRIIEQVVKYKDRIHQLQMKRF